MDLVKRVTCLKLILLGAGLVVGLLSLGQVRVLKTLTHAVFGAGMCYVMQL